MIIYNVTINIEADAHLEWLSWMQQVHIPQVIATGLFHGYRMLRVLNTQEDEEGFTYAIQYQLSSMKEYDEYIDLYATALRADTEKMFGGRYVAFRTLLEEV
jgi:hypothetical protein